MLKVTITGFIISDFRSDNGVAQEGDGEWAEIVPKGAPGVVGAVTIPCLLI